MRGVSQSSRRSHGLDPTALMLTLRVVLQPMAEPGAVVCSQALKCAECPMLQTK